MSFDELRNMAMGWVMSWNKGKLQKKLKETAQEALDQRIKILELEKKLKDQNNELRRLKGEKPKPDIKAVSTSELEGRKKKKHQKSSKKDKIEIDETFEVDVDKDELPVDAKKIGTREVVIQDIKFERRNVKFIIQRYWSDELGKTIEADIPECYQGREFGPTLRSFIMYQHYKCRTPHNKIRQILSDLGVNISAGSISNILTNLDDEFESDLDSAVISATTLNNVICFDETSAKLNGHHYYTFGMSNEYFARYSTQARKNKECALNSLDLSHNKAKFIVSDDAPNLKGHLKSQQLCWVHEIRKYKLCDVYKRIESRTLEQIIKIWRGFYKLMKQYRRSPSFRKKEFIKQEFDRITSIKTMVKPIDEQLARTRAKHKNLLLFLKYPKLPLHSNMIESDLRERVIKRKISLQNRSVRGVRAWDVMLSLMVTCRKIKLSFWNYLQDRIAHLGNILPLGKVIKIRYS